MLKVQPSEAPTASPTPRVQRDQFAGLSIVTALVNGVQVPVACPAAWCAEQHSAEGFRNVVDIDHTSKHANLYVPCFDGSADDLFAYALLGQDLYSSDSKMRDPHIRVEDSGESNYLTPEQALQFADNLTAFADQIRGLACTGQGETAVQA